ncbi:MAG: hypothetical protein GX032_02475 [Tenericutes bacterium]|nr:hypothetical protein [Bacilli bacterium]MDD4624009.1 hypothetical protein [Bacilli bacterium]MDD4831502.1 hypothetical protein [Bacilli bacterium]NLV90315.1 hypothetical protein [Mycoplasmatota bacterium]
MMMFISIYLMPILAVYFINSIEKKDKKYIYYLFEYIYYLVFINFIILFIMNSFFYKSSDIMNIELFTNEFTFKYMLISFVLCLVLPIITYYLKSVIKLDFVIEKISEKEVNKNEKKTKRSK